MYNIITQEFKKVKIFSENEQTQILSDLQNLENSIFENFKNLLRNLNAFDTTQSKGEILLEFRRLIEQFLRTELIVATENVYDKKLTVISNENIVFHLDKKYYSKFKLVSFMDIFKIETNDFKKILWNNQTLPPHLGLVLNYINRNYNSTYRFFTNRNMEYHCIYTFLYNMYDNIKELLNILNAYHYLPDEESLQLYNVSFEETKEKVKVVLQELKNLEKDFSPKLDK